ncbi:MAG: ribulose-phosphate 3-epimerase [Flavobacteriales bacterium]|nr:ribulose-phosphate 3-epimerase [Flavobacteriales bacterium]MCX7768930.1 ribulose-phosphate 3-epimerase [Flavobacteriales bacterium]MDW8409971.1 ribulose-phosphate 3-epimerase [Flavobacteriales bacterium]
MEAGKSCLLAPSLLSADFLRLGEELDMLQNSPSDWIHVDVMDGRFVPNISFGFPLLEAIRRRVTKPLDVHLMIEEPMAHARRFAEYGASIISIHSEAEKHLQRALSEIRSWGVKAGLALNPHTPIHVLEHLVDDVDLVLVMSVNPGFGGQKFLPETFRKLEQLVCLRQERKARFLIEVDGGVNLDNAPKLVAAGADVLVAGHAVFRAQDPLGAIRQLKGMGT